MKANKKISLHKIVVQLLDQQKSRGGKDLNIKSLCLSTRNTCMFFQHFKAEKF